MRKPKRLQEVGRADVRARNPRPRAEPPSDPILDAVSEDAEATTEDTAARSSGTVSSARSRTSSSVHRRVFGRNSWIGAFSSKNEILLRLLTVKLRGRPPTADRAGGPAISTGSRRPKPQAHHGPLQRLLAVT